MCKIFIEFIKNKNIIFVLILLCLINISLSAQNQVDVIYLKDGSKIMGTIIEQIPNSTIKVRMKDGSEFIYLFENIEKITKENDPTISPSLIDSSYSTLGINIGTPAGLNLTYAYWFGRYGIRFSGLVISSLSGIQFNIGYKLSDNVTRSHSLHCIFTKTLSSGNSANNYKESRWQGLGFSYELNYEGFFFSPGISFGSGTYNSPQMEFQLGYMYRFL